MAEEKRNEQTAEEMRTTQQMNLIINFAKAQQMSEIALKALRDSESPMRAIWLLLCAVDGMADEELQGMKTFSIIDIQNRRKEYLAEKDNLISELQQRVETLNGQVRKELEESREVRSSLEQGIERAWAAQRDAQAQLLASKDEMIEMLRKRIMELQQGIVELEQEREGVSNRDKKNEIQSENMPSQGREEEKTVSKKKPVKGRRRASEENNSPESSPTDEEIRIGKAEGTLTVGADEAGNPFSKFFTHKKRNEDSKKFIAHYLENEEMSDEQKEYLLSCMENGVTLKEMEKFASPKLSVEQMERLRKIQSQT